MVTEQPTSERTDGRRFSQFRKRTYSLADLGRHVGVLASHGSDLAAIYRGRVDPALREQLMLAVAQVNGCKYCTFVHTHWAQLEGVPDEELALLEGLEVADFDRDRWLALSYARALADADFAPQPDFGDEIASRSGSQARDDIELIARSMTLANLLANTLDAFVSRLRGNPNPDGRCVDEALIASALLAAGPATIVALSARLRMSPVRLVREMLRFLDNDTAS